METLYRKTKSNRYVPTRVAYGDGLAEGIWLVQTQPHSKSMTNLVYLVGDLKRPVDVVTHAAIQSMRDELTRYLSNLREEESAEYLEAKKMAGGFIHGPISIYNASCSDVIQLLLRKIALIMEEQKTK